MDEPKTSIYVDAPTDPNPPADPLDRPPPHVAQPQRHSWRVDREDDQGADPVAGPLSATAPSPPQQNKARTPPLEEEWEVRRIIAKRRVEKGFEYKVRWKDTWMTRSELANAKRLLQEFEAGGQAQERAKKRRTNIDKGR